MNTAQEQQYWQAIQRRDISVEGQFVYGVTSTRIFCRPGCPSKAPHRDRVRFFRDGHEAQRAGFRACLRCRPLETSSLAIQSICRYLEHHLEQPADLSELGHAAGFSPSHLQRKFKAALGISPKEYADACRITRFKRQLKTTGSVTEAIYDAGFSSNSRLYERSPAQLGMPPTRYKLGGVGTEIAFTIADSPIGRMLIATTATGICCIQFADSDKALEEALYAEFPNASITRKDALLAPHLDDLQAMLQGRNPSANLPLDIRATAFQRLVWNYLRTVPYGATQSYSEVARAIGKPSAARAVAAACAANRIAIAIPCHRVVQSTGEPGGYRWGKNRKRELLNLERDAPR